MTYNLTAPCHFGLEKTLSFEIRRAGGENIAACDGRVDFTGDESVIAKANITCSVAERIGIVLASFEAKTFDDIFYRLREIPIEEYAGRNDKLHIIKGHSLNSALTSIPAIQRTMKKAFVLRMQEKYHIGTLPETGAVLPIHFLLMKNKMTVTLDTSGVGLHKRGYRSRSNAAPIKETLAAGLVDLARVRSGDVVIDPFCGSGTILIEAALKAANIAPGLNRTFTATEWGFSDRRVWENAFEEARCAVKKDCFTLRGVFPIFISITSPTLTSYDARAIFPLTLILSASQASFATVLRFIRRETLRYLSSRIYFLL